MSIFDRKLPEDLRNKKVSIDTKGIENGDKETVRVAAGVVIDALQKRYDYLTSLSTQLNK